VHWPKQKKVSKRFAGKILSKLGEGLLVDLKTRLKNIPQGKGSISISDKDGLVLVNMRRENNDCTLHAYRQGLYQETSKLVSRATICQWFLKASNIRGSVQ
jgi:hypothetical protein